MKMRNMRDKVHEVGKLVTMSVIELILRHNEGRSQRKMTYFNPKYMFHVKVFRSCFAILLHDLPKRGIHEVHIISLNQHPTGDAPQILPLSGSRITLLPTGVLGQLEIIGR